MKTTTLELPTMYADHHVIEVRRILLEMPGVTEVYASSSFRAVEVSFDPGQVGEEQIAARLGEAGYLGELPVPSESGVAAYLAEDGESYFRHTAVYENTRSVVSFAQAVSASGRSLWPCPGLGVLEPQKLARKMEE